MRWRGGSLCLSVLAALLPGSVTAQRLADWPIRSSALPDAIVAGPSAAFWNPAALSTGSYRVQATLLNLHTPQLLDLSAIAGAVGYRVEKSVLAAAYQHVGVGDITLTEDSPGGEDAQKLDLGENHLALAAAHQVGSATTVGAIVRYSRDNLDGSEAIFGLGAGLLTQLSLPLQPRIGGYAVSESDDVIWSAAVEFTLPAYLGADYRTGLAYGVRSDLPMESAAHHVAAILDWKNQVSVSAAMVRQTDAASSHWQPMLAASLRLYRYQLAVVRETLVGDFGATWSFGVQVGFGP
jgi:hypothetical protein